MSRSDARAKRPGTRALARVGVGFAASCLLLAGVATRTSLTPFSPALALAFQPRPAPSVVAGSEIDFPPYAFIDGSGRPTGYSVDLLEAVARASGLVARVETGPWEVVRRKLETGQIDVIPFMAVSEERARFVDFTSAHLELHDGIFVRAGESRIASEADLRDKVVIVMAGDSSDDWITGLGIAKGVIRAPTLLEALELLANGKGDAVICAKVSGLYHLADKGLKGLAALPAPIEAYSRRFAFAVRKGDTVLGRRLEEGLAAVRVSGQYERIYSRWFDELDPERRKARLLKEALAWAVWGGMMLAGLLHIRMRLLRRDVERNKTARARAEEDLREQGVLHGQILDAIDDHIVVRGPDGSAMWANRAYRAFHGLPEDAFAGVRIPHAREGAFTHTHDDDERLVFESGRTVSLPEREIRSRAGGGGRAFLAQTNVSPALDARGEVLLAVSVSRDVTERRAQEALILEQRRKILDGAKMTALGEMSAGIAHEINNPLTVIYGRARMLQTLAEKGALDPAVVLSEARRIEATTERIARIVRSLKSFAREADDDPVEDAPLARVVDETLDFCRERFRRFGARVEVVLPVEPLLMRCRPVQVSQILLNLLNNAFDATEGLEERRIRIEGRAEGDHVVLEVGDSGAGVPRALRDTIFEPFFTTKDVGKGTGLGLSVSKGLAESQGGRISCEEIGGRCIFVLRVPASAAGAHAPAGAA